MNKAICSLLAIVLLFSNGSIYGQIETVIGNTTYDLQTNNSLQHRIRNHGDGTISAVWIYSEAFDNISADRGTGYNFFDGSNWGPIPTSRIENVRTGWPSISATATGEEIILCHDPEAFFPDVLMNKRSLVGSGIWALNTVPPTNQMWTRMTIGGSNGQTIHEISIARPWSTGGAPIQFQGALVYNRSLDGGTNWDIQGALIPTFDSSYYWGITGDAYHMAEAKGDTIAFAYFGGMENIKLAKSTNNGNSWTITDIIEAFPDSVYYDPSSLDTMGSLIGISDLNGDGIADTLNTSDGSGWVLLDQNGMAHVFFGNMEYVDNTPGDDQWFYFPSTNGLMYWNENFGTNPPVQIAQAQDLNGNGSLDITGIASYYISLSSQPSAGFNPQDSCIYVSYSSIMENMDQGSTNFRHIHIISSCDGGCTWSEPTDVTPGNNFYENVYASMANLVDSNIHIVYQRDFEPGITPPGIDLCCMNDIVYSQIPTDSLNSSPAICLAWIDGDSLLCSGDSVHLSTMCGTEWLWSNGDTTQSIWYKGAPGTVTVDITTPCGTLTRSISLAVPSSAPILTLTASQLEMCNGDQATLNVTSNAGGIISWSTGDSTASITVDSVGSYIVSVTNCGGTSADTVIISPPNNPPAFFLTATKTSICQGDTSWITASAVSQGSVLWSTGDTTWTIQVDTVGVYIASITNCGGTAMDTITISSSTAPAAVINGNNPFCSGDTIFLQATLVTDATYLWSTGDTTQFIIVFTEDSFSLTVTTCGGSNATNAITVFKSSQVSILTSDSTEFCEDLGAADVTLYASIFGSPPYNYLWSNGSTSQFITLDSASQSGVYSITVTDGCGESTSASDTISIYPPIMLSAVTITDPTSSGSGDGSITTETTGGTLPFTYLWDDPDAPNTQDRSGLFSGTYTCVVTDANGCADELSVTLNTPLVIERNIRRGAFYVNPNPNNGSFIVTIEGLLSKEYTLEIRNIIGQMVYAETFKNLSTSSVDITLPEGNKGVCFLTIGTEYGRRTEKLIVH